MKRFKYKQDIIQIFVDEFMSYEPRVAWKVLWPFSDVCRPIITCLRNPFQLVPTEFHILPCVHSCLWRRDTLAHAESLTHPLSIRLSLSHMLLDTNFWNGRADKISGGALYKLHSPRRMEKILLRFRMHIARSPHFACAKQNKNLIFEKQSHLLR